MDTLFWIVVIVFVIWFLSTYFNKKEKGAQDPEGKRGWQMLHKMRANISQRSYREKISISVDYSQWNNILEKVLGIKSNEILSRFESVGLKFEGDILGEFWSKWHTFSFENYRDVKSGLTISTVTFHGSEKSETYTSSRPIQSFIFNQEIRDFVSSVDHGGRSDLTSFAKLKDLTVSEIEERTAKFLKTGLDIEKLKTIISFENGGSIHLNKLDHNIGGIGGPSVDATETIMQLPIAELRILGRLRASSGHFKVSEGYLSYYFDILNDWRGHEESVRAVSPYSSVRPFDLLKKKLSDSGLTLNSQEDEWGVYGNGDSFHSKFATITYENEIFLEPEEVVFLDEEPTRQIAILIEDYNKENFKNKLTEANP
jgi:hypothetical protein